MSTITSGSGDPLDGLTTSERAHLLQQLVDTCPEVLEIASIKKLVESARRRFASHSQHYMYRANDSYKVFPIDPRLSFFKEAYRALGSNHWLATHFNPLADKVAFDALPAAKKQALTLVLGFLGCADALVVDYLDEEISGMLAAAIAAMYIAVMMSNEAIHQEFYNNSINALLGDDPEACKRAFDAPRDVPAVKRVVEWVTGMFADPEVTRGDKFLVALALEGLFFFAIPFAIIFWACTTMHQSLAGNTAVRTDETLHAETYVEILKRIPDRPSDERVYRVFDEMVDICGQFATDALAGHECADMSADKLLMHSKATANHWLRRLGMKPLYTDGATGEAVKSPCTYMGDMHLDDHALMFEHQPAIYRSFDAITTRLDGTTVDNTEYDDDF